MDAIARFISKNAVLLGLLVLITGTWSLMQIPDINVDNGIEVWLDHGSPEYLLYQQFQNDYGSDEWLLVAFTPDSNGTNGLYGEVKTIAKALRQISDRIQVFSIADADPWTRSRIGHLLLSKDRKVAGILLNLSRVGVIDDRQALVGMVKSALTPFEQDYLFHLGGPPVLNAELDRFSEKQSRIFISLAAVAALLVLYFLFRSFFYVMALILPAGLAVGWTIGTAVGCGMTLNMISTVLPVLLWVLTLTGGIHLISHFQKEYGAGASSEEAAGKALQAVLAPYAIASLTTAAGFLSLLFSHMEPVQNLGMWSATGIIIGFISNIVLIPAILHLGGRLPYHGKILRSPPPSLPHISPDLLRKKRKIISTAGIMILFVPLALIPFLRAESNVLSFFKDDSTLIRDYTFISSHLSGLSTIELDFRGSPDELAAYTRELSKRLKVIDKIKPIRFRSGDSIRMTIFVNEMDSLAFNTLVKKIRGIIAELQPDNLDTRLTGTIVLLNSIQEELVRTQIKSFALALTVIVTVLAFVFRSWTMVLIGSVVNLFPLMLLAGIAAVCSIPLNVATIMIASIAIGIAVDDTVFFLVRLRREMNRIEDSDAAINRTFDQMIGPISATTLVVAVGFLVLTLATFKPVAYFGLLGGLTMFFAWIGDMILLPALLFCFYPNSRK